jgi:hypothetical protein
MLPLINMSISKVSLAREALFVFLLLFLLHAGLYLQLHGHFNGTDAVQVI